MVVLSVYLIFGLWGCSEDPIEAQPNQADAVAPEQDVAPPELERPDCTEFEWEGEVYDCSEIDRCEPTEENFTLRVICANCDFTYSRAPGPGECPPDPDDPGMPVVVEPDEPGESCMFCHNGSRHDDYAGRYLTNPHPFPPAENIKCTGCHGGNGQGEGKLDSHVPPPPAITGGSVANTDQNLQNDPEAYFNRLTLVGIDKFEPAEYSYPNEILVVRLRIWIIYSLLIRVIFGSFPKNEAVEIKGVTTPTMHSGLRGVPLPRRQGFSRDTFCGGGRESNS